MGYSYGPVNVTLFKPKQYYISPTTIDSMVIQYDGRLLSINDNGSFTCTRRGNILISTVENGFVTLSDTSRVIYLIRPISTSPTQTISLTQTMHPPSWNYIKSGNNTWGNNPAYGKSVGSLDEAKNVCSGYNSLAYYNGVRWANCFNTNESSPNYYSQGYADLYKFY